jgi:hypothetical protein
MAVVGDSPEYITPRASIGSLAREITAASGGGGFGKSLLPVAINLGGRELWRGMLDVAAAEGLT